MAEEEADELQRIIESGESLPIWGHSRTGSANYLSDIELWSALRYSDRETLKRLHPDWSRDRTYRCDSLPERISEAFSDLLFGDAPTITADTEEDQEQLDEIVKANSLQSELKRWAADCSSEGEMWWRVYVNTEISDRPVLEMHSRLDVVPLWRGRHVAAVAFFNEIVRNRLERKNEVITEVYRHVEIQTDGLVRNLLYKGDTFTLGAPVDLGQRYETQDLDEDWSTGLDFLLAGRIVNKLGRRYQQGISHYQGIRDQLLDLNEARSIMAENARLAAKKRMVVPTSALDENGNFDAAEDIIPMEALNETLSEDGSKPGAYAILEYQFDAGPIIAHIKELESTSLTRVGLNVQFVNGDTNEGSAMSGTALRTRLIPTTLAASGLGQHWDAEMPKALHAMQVLDGMPVEEGGCGHDWQKPEEPPMFERGTVLPEDDEEKANRHSMLVQSELESLQTAIADIHPEWSPEEVTAEIGRIKSDRMPFGAPGSNDGSDEEPVDDFAPRPNPDALVDPAQTPAELTVGVGG